MARLREVIETERTVITNEGEVHGHGQMWTPEGELIVEWCKDQDNCEDVGLPE